MSQPYRRPGDEEARSFKKQRRLDDPNSISRDSSRSEGINGSLHKIDHLKRKSIGSDPAGVNPEAKRATSEVTQREIESAKKFEGVEKSNPETLEKLRKQIAANQAKLDGITKADRGRHSDLFLKNVGIIFKFGREAQKAEKQNEHEKLSLLLEMEK